MKRAVPIAFALMFALRAPTTKAQLASPRKDIPSIARGANGAIVTIVMTNNDEPISRGTGFLVKPDGVIVTNYHVIETGNVAIVKFPDGTILPVDGVLAANKVRDLAIIKIHGKTFRTLMLGNSDQVQVGEEVVAIGSPRRRNWIPHRGRDRCSLSSREKLTARGCCRQPEILIP
jgi:S1-C subfamily serine protease